MKLFDVFDRAGSFAATFFGRRARLRRGSLSLRGFLAEASTSPKHKELALKKYIGLIGLSAGVGVDAIMATIRDFDPAFGDAVAGEDLGLKHALEVLQALRSPNREALETALRICLLIGDKTRRRGTLQQLCLFIARAGDGNELLAKLYGRQKDGMLSKAEHEVVLRGYLESRSFDGNTAWARFFASLPISEIPALHQVYSTLGRKLEAAALAEENGAFQSAARYLLELAGTEASLRALSMSEKTSDADLRYACHISVAKSYASEGKYAEATPHYREAGQLERASDCLLQVGNLSEAIKLRPLIQPQWIERVRAEIEVSARLQLIKGEFAGAARQLHDMRTAWLSRHDASSWQSEADRVGRLLGEVVKSARSAFNAEIRASDKQPGTEVFKRWSHLEEAAGNYLEAALQAELAHDYFGASLLFEKAGAFGQALSALEQSEQKIEPKKRAELLELGGDFFMAGLIFEKIGEPDKAIAMYEGAGEFMRAADLRRKQIATENAAFDERWLGLLTKAHRVELIAELCLSQAHFPGCTQEAKARLFRRIKFLAESGLVAPRWLDEVASELPQIEAASRTDFERNVVQWAKEAERETLEMYLDCFGMDLGTSNSVVALFNRRTLRAEVVEWRGKRTIPSVFAVDKNGRELVGIPESELIGKSPRAMVTRAKREMGTDKRFKVDGQLYRPEEISARIISHARTVIAEFFCNQVAQRISELAAKAGGKAPSSDWVDAYLKEHPPEVGLKRAVITVPAYFNDLQKQATRTAATLANVEVLRLIHEPTAACLAQQGREQKDEKLLVVDLGAGTLDLSLLSVGGGVFEVEEIEGDNQLGSADLDDAIFSHFAEIVKRETGHETRRQELSGRRLLQACEDIKIELSSHPSWTVRLPHLVENKSVDLILERATLEKLASQWLRRIEETCLKIKGRPTHVLLVGGGGLMPAVRKRVREVFHMEPSMGTDPLTAVARGAAIQAAILAGTLKEQLVLDVVPFSLGIKLKGESASAKIGHLIRKHATIPVKANDTFTTTYDYQSQVRIEVFQGEDQKPEHNFKIGEFLLDGIPPTKAGVPKIEVTFEIDQNCLLKVTARDAGTHRERQITITDSHLLAPAQVNSLQQRLRNSQERQHTFDRLRDVAGSIASLLGDATAGEVPKLKARFAALLRNYESNMARYAPTASDSKTLMDAYRERYDWENKGSLALDRWESLKKSANSWLVRQVKVELRSDGSAKPLDAELSEGEVLLNRVKEGAQAISQVTETFRRWVSVLEGLALNSEGSPEELARHFLRLARYDDALKHFLRMGQASDRRQISLGLEIFARSRQRDGYMKLLTESSGILGINRPDFVHLNASVKTYASSVVWIHQPGGTGSGFAIGNNAVATNRHVVTSEPGGKVIAPRDLRIVSKNGVHTAQSIHLPDWGPDDIAIIILAEDAKLVPFNIGFSELVEVGERILTLGFPAAHAGAFEENLYCNVGLVNRIRPSEFCSERVLEVSIELQGGISGAPVLNEMGEVVGLVTFTLTKTQRNQEGQMHFERSFHAVPVELLRRLRAKLSIFDE